MPIPLFPFTWQYNNQPIEVLAENIASVVVNSSKVIPVVNDNANGFVDSTLTDDAVSLRTRYLASPNTYEDKGFSLNYAGNKYAFGDYDGANNGTVVAVNDALEKATLEASNAGVTLGINGADGTLVADGVSAATAGAAAALFLKVTVDSVDYKIQLLNV